jgi:hypothetical protein
MNAIAFTLSFLPLIDIAAEEARRPLAPRIDALLLKKDLEAAPLASDAVFLRRVSLDLTGMIPSAEQTRAFLGDSSANKRVHLVDRLLASDGYARHMATTFDILLMDRRPAEQVKLPEWQDYLRRSFAENKPVDQLVRELLGTDGSDAKNRAAARFLLDRKVEPHVATKDIGRLFLGMNLTCCQCHDHPLVEGFKQDHYYGIFAFLNRTYAFADKKLNMTVLAEKGEGDVTFESVFKPKIVNKTGPKLPYASELPEPKFEKGAEYVAPVPKGERGTPKFSRRAQLGDGIVTHPYFARTLSNRVWSWLFGRGIIHPVEYDHDGNSPSHPELLDLLAADFQANGHNLKRLLREIVLSQTYQRSSESKSDKTPPPETFLVSAIRPLSPDQFAWSLAQATGQLEAEWKAAKTTEAAVITKLAPTTQSIVALFSGPSGEPAVNQDFEATLDQALFLNNGKTLESWLAPRPSSLADRLAKAADGKALANELYLSVLIRPPTDDERDEVVYYLDRKGADRSQAIRDLTWALLTSVEFRFNH